MHVRKWTHLARRVIPCQSCGAVIVAAGFGRSGPFRRRQL